MRFFQLALFCFICVAKTHSQTATRSYHDIVVEITKEKKPKKIYTKVTSAPGMDSTWIQSLEDSLNRSIPFKNGAKAGKYLVSVKILVEKDGSVFDVDCLKDPGFGMCEQVKSAIKKKTSPKWRPQLNDNSNH